MTLLGASANRSRFLPDVLDDCSRAGLKFSPSDRAIVREMNQTACAMNFLETGGVAHSESCAKVERSILSTGLASLVLHRLHCVTSDFIQTTKWY